MPVEIGRANGVTAPDPDCAYTGIPKANNTAQARTGTIIDRRDRDMTGFPIIEHDRVEHVESERALLAAIIPILRRTRCASCFSLTLSFPGPRMPDPSEAQDSTKPMKLAFEAATPEEAKAARDSLSRRYDAVSREEADVIVALGGDGHMLETLRANTDLGKPIYGMNRGTVGFLMNHYDEEGLVTRIRNAVANTLYPLRMHAVTRSGEERAALAINEVSLFRESAQTAKISIVVDGKPRLAELV